MPADVKNIYGLSEGVFKACQFLGLKFPPTVPENTPQEHNPSDFFGNNVKMNLEIAEKLQAELQCSKRQLAAIYKNFSDKYLSQKCFEQTLTDLNVYFCDYLLFVAGQLGANASDYFAFEFHKKSFALRNEFVTERHRNIFRTLFNERYHHALTLNKFNVNNFFADFLHRDWLNSQTCTFEEFKAFVEKHPRFFSKPFNGTCGWGAEIISVAPNVNLKKLFKALKDNNSLVEEIVKQHETLKEFCPDTVNTVRFNTFLDIHNVVHILSTTGKFGRIGGVVDNVQTGNGASVAIDPKTGIILTDGLSRNHERIKKHPDTGKIFKGFQYPCWEKMRATVIKMAKMIPQLRHIGWDITINDKEEIVLIELNTRPDVGLQQAPDDFGKLHLYLPLVDELINYKITYMQVLGYHFNNLLDFDSAYNTPTRQDSALKFAMNKLIPDCTSLMDLGCRKTKFVQSVTPTHLSKYYPVDFQKHDDEVIVCDFNKGEFPDIQAATCFCALTAEFVELLPQFLANMCNAAQKQILMLCRPFTYNEIFSQSRWENPLLTDFTEEFLIDTMQKNKFQLSAKYPSPDNAAIILYDFRKVSSFN